MRRLRRLVLVGGVVALILYGLLRPAVCDELLKMPSLRYGEVGAVPTARATLVGFQPYMEPRDYRCERSFAAKVGAYLDSARARGYLRPGSVAVFPEYIGTWLVLMRESGLGIRWATTLQGALTWFVLRHPWAFWKAYKEAQKAGLADPAAAAVFQVKAEAIARAYHRTFSSLSRRYGVTLVAGSVVLPGARIQNDSLVVQVGAPLENVSVVYGPDGRPFPQIVRKAFPIATELTFTRPGRVEELPVFQTAAGRLGVLICADSWFPQSYQALGRVDLLVVPSYLMGDSCWGLPWRGYSGWPAPPDVRSQALTEGEAWLTYAMGGRLPRFDTAAVGLNVFLRGRFWELGADGRAIVVWQGRPHAMDADIVAVPLPTAP